MRRALLLKRESGRQGFYHLREEIPACDQPDSTAAAPISGLAVFFRPARADDTPTGREDARRLSA
jgi:hypothetical protein